MLSRGGGAVGDCTLPLAEALGRVGVAEVDGAGVVTESPSANRGNTVPNIKTKGTATYIVFPITL